jgi:hypothetical protein
MALVCLYRLTSFTQIEARTHRTLVADPNNRVHVTIVAHDSLVNSFMLPFITVPITIPYWVVTGIPIIVSLFTTNPAFLLDFDLHFIKVCFYEIFEVVIVGNTDPISIDI